ncbi:tRNA (adenosine(37)-N6)-threonylcarbamoyltransferase complex dimerization subunit type 1 TsaB [candidate division NPL-UPA2 bacterium]|nr:tRNA (adenosine(37)-N6)-threonylcarbamoyltransferase complex dimerization subunit type 1 TsaB [candidate division NPL-UPA2 bacterium]
MRLLGIETSTQAGSVAIVEGEEIIAEYALNIKETHTSRLMSMIDHVLKNAHLTIQEMDAVAISLGPGSFTGLRIGLATAKGLCLALRKPLIGIPTLNAFAHNVYWTSQLICPLLDARRGEVYAALYRYQMPFTGRGIEKLTGDLVLSLDELLSEIDAPTIFLGDVLRSCRGLIEGRLGKKASFAPPYLSLPRAANIAILGLEKLEAGAGDDLEKIAPLYVRQSEVRVSNPS